MRVLPGWPATGGTWGWQEQQEVVLLLAVMESVSWRSFCAAQWLPRLTPSQESGPMRPPSCRETC